MAGSVVPPQNDNHIRRRKAFNRDNGILSLQVSEQSVPYPLRTERRQEDHPSPQQGHAPARLEKTSIGRQDPQGTGQPHWRDERSQQFRNKWKHSLEPTRRTGHQYPAPILSYPRKARWSFSQPERGALLGERRRDSPCRGRTAPRILASL